MPSNIKRRLFIIAALFLVAIICFGSYKASHSLPIQPSPTAVITNDYILSDTLPQNIVTYTKNRISRWSSIQQHISGGQYVIANNSVNVDSSGYAFTIYRQGTSEEHSVKVVVTNLGNFFSITVSIDNEIQNLNN